MGFALQAWRMHADKAPVLGTARHMCRRGCHSLRRLLQALLCLAALISGSLLQQDQLAEVSVKSASGEVVPLLQAVLQVAVSAQSAAEQVAADRLLEAYCCGNAAGQSVLASSLRNTAAAVPDSFGGYLLLSLGWHGSMAEVATSSRAAAAVSHVVGGNAGIQTHLLTLQVQLQTQQQQQQWRQLGHTNSSASSLMALCTSHLGLLVTHYGQQPVSVRAAANILRLLLLWLHGCPPAVTAFLRAVAHSQPFLVDSIRGSNACSTSASSSNPLTRSMLALLLGLCALYAEDAAGTPSQQQLLTAIDKQIGQEQYLSILDSLQHQPAVKDSSSSGSIFGEEPSISPAFAACLAMLAAEVRKSVTGASPPAVHPVPAPPAPHGMRLSDGAAPPAPSNGADGTTAGLTAPITNKTTAMPTSLLSPPTAPVAPSRATAVITVPSTTAPLLPVLSAGMAPAVQPNSHATTAALPDATASGAGDAQLRLTAEALQR